MSDEKKVTWYDYVKEKLTSLDRAFENLDTRETVLQKDVERIKETLEWLGKLREEQTSWNRWAIGMILSVVFSLLSLVVGLWKVIQG